MLLTIFPLSQVFAAPASAVGEGTITAIVMETDIATAITTVVVTLEDGAGLIQTVRLSLESAIAEGLVIPDISLIDPLVVVDILDPADLTLALASGGIVDLAFVTDPAPTTLSVSMVDPEDTTDPQVITVHSFDLETAVINSLIIMDETKIGTAAAFDPAIILDSTEFGKVVSKVGSFFATNLGVDYAALQAYQDDGFGYGEIVQAAWMAYLLDGDASTLDQILTAKASGDYSGIVLPDGSTADNWGQLRKAVLTDPKQNLGQIVSGKAVPLSAPTEAATAEAATTSSSQSMNGNGNTDDKTNNGNTGDKTNNGNTDDKTNNGNTDDKTNNGNTDDKTNNGNTKDKTNNGKKP